MQFYILLRHKLNLPNITSPLARTVVAATLLGLVVWLADDQNQFLLIGLGVVVYIRLAPFLRLLDVTEWDMILRLLCKRNGPQSVNEVVL